MVDKLERVAIINHSGFFTKWQGLIPPLRKGNYYVQKIHIAGDAPKDFIHVYEYGEARKKDRKKWPGYIAKVGHKWYPMESITEHLLNKIGGVLGLKMAQSRLMLAGDQIRFLSKYFLKKDERLVHGAQIYAGFLEDKTFVEKVEAEGMARDLFTFQFSEEAIRSRFPNHADDIMEAFIKMLIFDAIVGNNDRHFYNWGVIIDLLEKKSPTFAPVYDTARGLFWNYSEERISRMTATHDHFFKDLSKYAKNSVPKIGWEKVLNINHFRLVELLHKDDRRYCNFCKNLLHFGMLERINSLLDEKFSPLMSPERMLLIKACLKFRYKTLNAILLSVP